MQKKRPRLGADVFVLILAFILSNLRASLFFPLFPDAAFPFGLAWIEIVLWIFAAVVASLILRREGLLGDYLSLWRANWPLIVFVLLALASVLWSIDASTSWFHGMELLFTTLLAAYIGTKYSTSQFLQILFWFGAILVILTVAVVVVFPDFGRMGWQPSDRPWRGIYWHRNHLGSIMAFVACLYLLRTTDAVQWRRMEGWLDGFLYVFSSAIVYLTASVAGYLTFIILHVAVVLVILWLATYRRLKRAHYFIALGAGAVGLALILGNLNRIFALVHRDATLTGRVGLWSFLLHDVVSQRPWLGHGFGAIWSSEAFRVSTQLRLGWGYPVDIADNGFIDILLHIGALGLLVFLGVLLLVWVRAFTHALANRTLTDFFPLLVMLYSFVANISFSLFMETETFVWMMIVAVLFIASRPSPLGDTQDQTHLPTEPGQYSVQKPSVRLGLQIAIGALRDMLMVPETGSLDHHAVAAAGIVKSRGKLPC